MPPRRTNRTIEIETLRHTDAKRRNIPTAELQSVLREEDKTTHPVAYQRRNHDLDPQLMWRGKDEQNITDLIVPAPPLYIQEKIHSQVLIEDLRRESKARQSATVGSMPDLFADFNGLHDVEAKTEFYAHNQNWTNRLILGDSIQVMASLAEREGLRGQVQCIYFDPPYGIKFNSNFQWSTTSRDVKDGKSEHITREPEQVKAFRDTWRDGIHSYLTYLRDRLTVARDLLTESGSIFVQIGDENVHRVRALMDEIFGEDNFVSQIWIRKKTMPLGAKYLEQMGDYILFYAKNHDQLKYRKIQENSTVQGDFHWNVGLFGNGKIKKLSADEISDHKKIEESFDPARLVAMSPIGYTEDRVFNVNINGKSFYPPSRKSWKTDSVGMYRLQKSLRLLSFEDGERLNYLLKLSDYSVTPINTNWSDTSAPVDMKYVVETSVKPIQRCILMCTDPGDLVLDPTCGSGTTAYVSEQWGRRWITIDTSRVALALARSRLMGARYPYYLLADSEEGLQKEAELARLPKKTTPTYGNLRQGFVYERVPHITLKSIANNAEIDLLYEQYQPAVLKALNDLNIALAGHKTAFEVKAGGRSSKKIDFTSSGVVRLPSGEDVPSNALLEWEVPQETPKDWPESASASLKKFWQARLERQKAIDASIAAKAEMDYLYDRPYTDNSKVRVAGPFTVETISPHRVIIANDDDSLGEILSATNGDRPLNKLPKDVADFAELILNNLRIAGVQQANKADKITFTSLVGWPGEYICAEGKYMEGEQQRRAGIFIGPEFGTVARPDLVAAAREAADAGFDVLIACAFNYDAHSTEFEKLGRIPVLKARMNADLHMANDLKATGTGNLFVVFGEPDIRITETSDGLYQVIIQGIDVFKPQSGEIVSGGPDDIALWMLDTNYNEESFFVRHAYFLGANDPYKALRTTLKAEIDEEAWSSLHSDTSRPFPRPTSGRIAVKVINHLGDEVMKVFSV